MTVILTIVSYVCLDPILTLMQIPADIYGLMRSYMGLILAGLIFVFLYNYFAFLLRSSGNSVIPLIFSASELRLISDWIFSLSQNSGAE